MADQIDIEEFTGRGSSRTPHTAHRRRLAGALAHFQRQGLDLKTVCDDRHLGMSAGTVKKWCRLFGIVLADYTPRALKKKEVARKD